MTRVITIDIDPVDVDPNGLADGVSSAVVQILLTGALTSGADLDGLADGNSSAGASVTLDGVLTGGGAYVDATGIARHIHILDLGGDVQTGATYTITGTDSGGNVLTEAIAGPAASGFVITNGRFSRVLTIAIASPAAGSTVDIGVNGVFTSADGLAHQLDIIDTGADIQTGATYTITGTDEDNLAQTEDIAGPGSGATIETVNHFKIVTSITIASPVATSTIDVGTVDEVSSQAVPLRSISASGATINVNVTGTIDFSVQQRFDNIQLTNLAVQVDNWQDISALNAKTVDTTAIISPGAAATRIIVNSYSSGAELQMFIAQPPYRG